MLDTAAYKILDFADRESMWGRVGSTPTGNPLLLSAAIIRAAVEGLEGVDFNIADLGPQDSDDRVWRACEGAIVDMRDRRRWTRVVSPHSSFHRHLLLPEPTARLSYPRRCEALSMGNTAYGVWE